MEDIASRLTLGIKSLKDGRGFTTKAPEEGVSSGELSVNRRAAVVALVFLYEEGIISYDDVMKMNRDSILKKVPEETLQYLEDKVLHLKEIYRSKRRFWWEQVDMLLYLNLTVGEVKDMVKKSGEVKRPYFQANSLLSFFVLS